jgi:hypothetical protein
MAEDKDSSRTKLIKEKMKDGIIKDVTVGASRLGDKMGFTQEDKYKDKTMDELAKKPPVKKAMGGAVKYAKGGVTRADGCVTKGHTKGKIV